MIRKPSAKEQLKHQLEAHFDVEHDLIGLIDFCNWVSENYFDQGIPMPYVDGRFIDLRAAWLDAALIRYRRCFNGSQRGSIDLSKSGEVLESFQPLHEDHVLKRASKVLAHAVHACHSATIFIHSDRTITRSIQRPGVNQYDFDNIRVLCGKWLPFVQSEIERLSEELRPLLTDVDFSGNSITVSPFGSNVDIQAQRRKRSQ